MRTNFRNALASNLMAVILIFLLLIFFDNSGNTKRNIVIIIIGFVLLTLFDFIRIWLGNRSGK